MKMSCFALAGTGACDFDEAIRLKDDSEYPHVASVQVAVAAIETAIPAVWLLIARRVPCPPSIFSL